MKSSIIRARTESNIKNKAEAILNELGMTPSQVINMLYRQIIFKKAIPFEISIPNQTTLDAIKDEEGSIIFDTPEALFEDLGI